MRAILKPISHPDLGEIVINDSLFSIGRYEPPFSSYPPEAVARLSRRHARIFVQDGVVHIVDLGSLNGTTVNGKPLPQDHLQLQQNDRICFAGQLTYSAELLSQSTASVVGNPEAAKVILTLTPLKPDTGIEPIVVSEFPFLISKSNEVFSRYEEESPDELTYISRRHAHIFNRQGALYIEDLGSTNGTFLSENRLDEKARILCDGDSIAFGGNHFIYNVKVNHIEPQTGQSSENTTVLIQNLPNATDIDITRTTFVTSANSFLDIFCMESEEQEQQASIDENASSAKNRKKQEARKRAKRGRLARSSTFMQEVRGAFSEERPAGGRRIGRKVAATAAVAIALLSGYLYLQDSPKREIVRLIAEGNYARSIRLADKFLIEHPNDKEVPEQAAKALAQYVVPDWKKNLSKNEFRLAYAALEQARQLIQHNSSGLALLDLMKWITQLEAFIHERGGDNAPIAIFEHEMQIDALLNWWNDDIEEHRRIAGQIARYEPAFEGIRAMAFSHLRTLRNEKSTYLTALERFKQTLEEKLESDRVEGLRVDISDFHTKYPRISGIDKLEQDLQNYLLVREEVKAGHWLDAARKINELDFQTPIFFKKIVRIRARQLPSDGFLQQFQQVSDMWRSGQPDEAIAILESLKQGAWEQSARSELERKQAMLDQYRALEQSRKRDGYAQELIAFFSSLDPLEDNFFIQAIQGEFQIHRDKVRQDADRSLSIARVAWDKYQKTGGIRGLQRLESRVSIKFRKQANYLTDAYKQAHQGAEIYKLLKIEDDTSGAETLYQTILKECRLQRRSLQELGMVLEPSLLQAKIQLLPEPDSTLKLDPKSAYNLVRGET